MLGGFAPATGSRESSATSTPRSGRFGHSTAREADDIRPNRLDFYTVRPATRGSRLRRAAEISSAPAELAIMNNHAVNDQPDAGERIKIVVEGLDRQRQSGIVRDVRKAGPR